MAELLEILLNQTNEHLRETDRKKNQTYYFFLVLTGLYFSLYTRLSESWMIIVVTFVLAIIGIVMNLVIIYYQMWHSIYVNTAIILQKIMCKYKECSKLNVEEIRSLINKHIDNYPFYGHGTEFYFYNSFLLVTSSLFGLFMYNMYSYFIASNKKLTNTDCLVLIVIIIVVMFYIYIFNYIRKIKLERAKNEFLDKSWILKFIEE